MNHVIKGCFYGHWSFSYNFFVKFHDKKIGTTTWLCNTVNPLYNDIRYNRKIRYNIKMICTKITGSCIFFSNSNQPTSCCRATTRWLVAITEKNTIRGSVLFYSSAIWRPDFRSVKKEFRYLYGVDSIELRTLFYLWKMSRDHHWHRKNTKSKSESRRCQFCWYFTCIITIRLGDFFDQQKLER